jgi:hypothetical protein
LNNLSELIKRLISEKIKSVSERKDDSDLCVRFEKKMIQQYGKYDERLKANPEIASAMIEEWYRSEINSWGYLSDNEIYSRFTPDETLLEIDKLSSLIFSAAIEKNRTGLSNHTEVLFEYLKTMKRLSANVMKENSKLVAKIISESTVEVNYICGNTKNMSLRMANYLRNIT